MRGIISKMDGRWRATGGIAILLVLTGAMYVRPSMLSGSSVLLGHDFNHLHARRMAFAQSALFGPRHTLPGWYPHEFMGTPFSANMQSFPWIPTRLLLLPLDPDVAYAAGVAIAAMLAALFTYLFCRRAGLSQIGSMAAGWTFACSGYFMARVLAGHLPLLEAYPALPLLLWLADRALSPDRVDRQARDLIALAVACACIAVAGHPQIPAYALATALLYVIVRGRGRQRLKTVAAMVLGLGTTLLVWWPMLLLIQRSTRVLHLAPADNDIVMPYSRLLALFVPGVHGWVDSVALSSQHPFTGYPNDAYFWDTVAYVGLLPLIVILLLSIGCVVKKRLPAWPWSFLAAVGFGALILALPVTNFLRNMTPGTFFRSPSRLLYISTFAASVALGFGVSAFLKSKVFAPRMRHMLVAYCLLLHVADLGAFGLLFVRPIDRSHYNSGPYEQTLAREVKDGRIGLDYEFVRAYGDRFDDAGVFDSLLLANPYRTILRLQGEPPDLNTQEMDGSDFTLPALRATGVEYVVTMAERKDLTLVDSSNDDADLYRVPDPAPRASFYADEMVDFLAPEKIVDAFAAPAGGNKLLLPVDGRGHVAQPKSDRAPGQVIYSRPSSDEIRLDATTDRAGYAYVVEAYDPGWTADVDGKASPVVLANGFAMAIPTPPGKHSVRLSYRTQGRMVGGILSMVSACLLAGLIWTVRRSLKQRASLLEPRASLSEPRA
jgi:hypothetical protein